MRYLFALLWAQDDPLCSQSSSWTALREELSGENWTANVHTAWNAKVSSSEYCVFGAASVSVWRFLGHYLNRDTHNALRELHRMNLMRVPVEYGQLPGWGVPFKEVNSLRATMLEKLQREPADRSNATLEELSFYIYDIASSPFCDGNYIYDWFRISPYRTMDPHG